MRFLFRFMSLVALVFAVVAATFDSIQSVAASSVVLTSLGSAIQSLSPPTLSLIRERSAGWFGEGAIGDGVALVLLQPAFTVLLVLSLAFWMMGYKRRKPAGRFAA